MPVVTLLTDFGDREGFVAAMKAVITSLAPGASILDAAHHVPRGDVEAAAWTLSQYWNLFPPRTIHVGVVDPGVGSGRSALALEADDRLIVAPDNGLVTRVIRSAGAWRAVEITERSYLRADIAPTFHGRDVFAPVAGHLAAGVPLERLGPAVEELVQLDLVAPTRQAGRIRGRVAHIDGFGNLISDIPIDWLGTGIWRVAVAGHEVGPVRESYADVEPGAYVVVRGSAGTLEIAVRDGSAAAELRVDRGAEVVAGLAGRGGS